MHLGRKIGITAVVGCLAVAGLGTASSASAASVLLITGQNSPNGTVAVAVPSPATSGAVTAFTQVITAGPGDISNLQFVVVP